MYMYKVYSYIMDQEETAVSIVVTGGVNRSPREMYLTELKCDRRDTFSRKKKRKGGGYSGASFEKTNLFLVHAGRKWHHVYI